jgi:hypothetical protein
MGNAWIRTAVLAAAVAGFGFAATLQAAPAACDCQAQREQCLIDNQNNWPGPQLDCETMFRLCQRRTCAG